MAVARLDSPVVRAYPESVAGEPPSRVVRPRLRVLRGGARDPLNLIQIMLAKGMMFL